MLNNASQFSATLAVVPITDHCWLRIWARVIEEQPPLPKERCTAYLPNPFSYIIFQSSNNRHYLNYAVSCSRYSRYFNFANVGVHRMKYYYYHISKERKSILQLILPAIWGLFPPGPNRPLSCSVTWPEAEAYLRHYESLLQDQSLVDGVSLSMGNLQNRDNDVIGFTQFVKDRLHRQLDLVRVDIRNSPPAFLLETDDAAVNKALEFAMRLWLFSSLDENRLNPASSNAASPLLHEAVFKPGASSRSSGRRFLSKDFSAKHIMRKTDFIFKPTGNLSEHLTFDLYRTNTIRFFACAKAIEKFRFEEQWYENSLSQLLAIYHANQSKALPTMRSTYSKSRGHCNCSFQQLERRRMPSQQSGMFGSFIQILKQRLSEWQMTRPC